VDRRPLGAGVLILIAGLGRSDYLASVEWDTLPFVGDLARTAGNPSGRQRPVAAGDSTRGSWCGLRGSSTAVPSRFDPRRGRTLIALVRGVIDDRVGVRVPTEPS